MASVELATAYVSLVPTMKGAQGTIARELGSVDADGIGKDVGGRMGGGITGTLKGLVGPALAAAAAIGLGGFVAEAAAASDATDKFKSTMNFAGIDTSGIEAATKAAKTYADQTVYDLPTIQATMAQLASNGVTNYTDLTQAAGNLNAVAGGNAETFKSVSRTLTQSAGAGKLMTEDWNMLADAIPGASGVLQKAMKDAGAYTGNFKDAMAAGEITSTEFQDALMKLGSDPIAVEAGKSVTTFEGAIGGLQATINSGLMGALDALKPAITGAINGVSAGLSAAFGWIGNAWSGLRDIILKGDFTGALSEAFGLDEDSPAVSWLLQTHDIVTKGIPAIRDLLVKGDFTGGMLTAFGLDEDSPAVGFLLKTHDVLANGLPALKDLIVGGDYTGALRDAFGLEEDSPAVGFILRTRAILTQGIPALKDLLIGGDFTGAFREAFNVEEDSPIVDKLFTVRETVIEVFNGIKDFLLGVSLENPALDKLEGNVRPLVLFGAQVRDVFNQIFGAIGPLLPSMFALWQAVSPVSTIFAALGPSIMPLIGTLGTLAGSIAGSLIQAITGILPAIQTLQGVFISLFTDVLATVLPVIVQLVDMFGQTLATLIPILVPIITQIVTLAATLVSQLAPIFMQLVSTVLPMVVTAIGAILPVIGPLIEGISGLLIPVIQALMPVVVTVFGVIADVIGSVMQIVMGVIQVVTGIISGNWSQVWTGIGNIFAGIWNTIVAAIGGYMKYIFALISAGLGLVAGFVGSTLGSIGRFFADTWNNIVNGVSSMIGNVVGFFGGLIGKIAGAIGNAGSALFSVGVNIIQGLINGIGSMMGAIGRAVLNIVPEAIRGPFEQLLGIHSPSRVFRGYGVNIGQGLILGIGDMHSDIESAVNGMVTVPTAPTYGANTAAGDYRTTGGFGSTFNIYETDDPIATAHAVSRRQTALAT